MWLSAEYCVPKSVLLFRYFSFCLNTRMLLCLCPTGIRHDLTKLKTAVGGILAIGTGIGACKLLEITVEAGNGR